MRSGRLILLGAAAALTILVAGIWLLPGVLDWTRYREGIASLAASAIGRPVRISGPISLQLLPQPVLAASGVTVDDPGDGVSLGARELRLRVGLGSLLAGRVDARELVLRGADLHLPWPPTARVLGWRPPAWLTGLQARVESGRVEVGGLAVTDIAASVATDPLTGTLSAAGTASMFGRSWRFTTRLAQPGRDGAAGLEASLDGTGKLQDTGMSFSGALAGDGSLTGALAGRGADLSQLIPAPALPWRAEGTLSCAGGLVVADELAVDLGGSPGRGAVALRVAPNPRLDIAVTASRLELDAWIPMLLRGTQPGSTFTLPTGVDLSAEAATLAGATLRRVRAALDLDTDGVVVHDTTAILPGDAQLMISGRLPGSRKPVFDGIAHLQAPDLRPSLAWLEGVSPALFGIVPLGALRAADLTGKVVFDQQQVSLSDITGTLDGSPVQGGLSLRFGPRIGISAGLTLDRLALDPWLPNVRFVAHPAEAFAGLTQALAHAAFDTDVKLQARAASWQGIDFGPLSIDAQSEAGRLTLRRLETAAAGLRIAGSGTLGEGGRVSEGRLELSADEALPLAALVPAHLARLRPLLRGPAGLWLQFGGPPDALATHMLMDLGDLRVEASPVINLAARRAAGSVTMHHPGAPRLLATIGVPDTASWLGDGSFSVIAQVAVAAGQVSVDNFALVAGALRASGQLGLGKRTVTGRVTAETLPLPMPDPQSQAPLPLAGLRRLTANVHLEAGSVLFGLQPALDKVAVDLALDDGALRAGNFTAQLDGGQLAGSASLVADDVPRLAVQADAHGLKIDGPLTGATVDLTEGTLDAHADLTADGYSVSALLATLAGSATAHVQDGVTVGFSLQDAAAALANPDPATLGHGVRAALEGGRTPFKQLEARVTARQGTLLFNANEEADAGTARLSGTIDLQGGAVDARLAVLPGGDAPALTIRLTGPATQPVRTPELAALARWLAERS